MAYQLLQTFSICILSWLLHVPHFICFCFSLSVWIQLNALVISRMTKWAATTFGKWRVGPLTSALHMWRFLLPTLLVIELLPCQADHTVLYSRGRYSYYEAFHTDLQQYGNGQYLCGKTWEAPCSLEPETAAVACASSISRACAQVALSWGHHHCHLLRWWYFPVFPQKLAQCKKAHHPC